MQYKNQLLLSSIAALAIASCVEPLPTREGRKSEAVYLDKADPAAADDMMLLNQLYLAQDKPVRIRLRSMDVIHSFFLPNFRVKQDAVPGMTVDTWFVPKHAGDFDIACAEHCGLGHYRMRGQVHVVARLISVWRSRKAIYVDSINSRIVSPRAISVSGAYAKTASPSSL